MSKLQNKNNLEIMENPLFHAYRNEMYNQFCKLLNDGKNINCINKEGETLISEIIKNEGNITNNKKYFNKLLSCGVSLERHGVGYDVVNLSIIKQDDIYYMKKLLENGACVNSFGMHINYDRRHPYYGPPIFESFWREDLRKINLLLKHNPQLNLSNCTATPILNYLFKYGTSSMGIHNTKKIIPILIEKGATVDERDYSGKEPIHYWAESQIYKNSFMDKILNLLLKNNANINSRNERGNTPVMLSAKIGRVSSVLSLISHGANLDIQNAKGKTAAMMIDPKNSYKILEILENNNANFSLCDKLKKNVTHYIAKKITGKKSIKNHKKYIEFIKRHEKLAMQKNLDGETAMDIIKRDKNKNHKND